jgi:hypothetical protein
MTLNDEQKKAVLARLTNKQFRRRRIRSLWCRLTYHDWLHISVPHDPDMLDGRRIVTLVCFRCSDCRVIDVTGEDYRRGRWDPQCSKSNKCRHIPRCTT